MPSCGYRVRSSAPAVGWCIGCCRGTRGSPSSSGCSTPCAVDAVNLEVGVRTLRPAAATWTEEAEGGDDARTSLVLTMDPLGEFEGALPPQRPPKTSTELRLFKG